MSSGILNGLGGRKQAVDGVSRHQEIPIFEQLEPRLLLSADISGMQLAVPALDTSYEQAIEIDLIYQEDKTIHNEPAVIETLETPSSEDPEEVISPIVTLQDYSDDNDISEDEASFVCDIGYVTVNLEPVALSSPDIQDNQAAMLPVYNENNVLDDSETTPIEIRGPPADNGEYSTISDYSNYVISDAIAGTSDLEGAQQLNAPDLPGLQLVDPDISSWDGQIIYLDFDGAEDVVYNGPVTFGPFDVPAFSLEGTDLAGQEEVIIFEILSELEQTFAGTGVIFTIDKPYEDQIYSTVYIGGDDSAFTEYGSFLGLAEQVDVENQNLGDNALIFSEKIVSDCSNSDLLVASLEEVVAHEAGHLLGYEHAQECGLGILRDVAELVDPFDRMDFSGTAGGAVQGLMERVAGGLKNAANAVPLAEIKQLVDDFLEGVEVSAAVEVSAHFFSYTNVQHGIGIEVTSAYLRKGFAFAWDILNDEWTVSRGIVLQVGTVEFKAEEYVTLKDTEIAVGVRLSAAAEDPLPKIDIGPTTVIGAELQATIEFEAGTYWTLSIEQQFGYSEFAAVVGQPTVGLALLDVFTPYGDKWWELLAESNPITAAISTGLDLLGFADFNNSPVQLLDNGSDNPSVRFNQTASASLQIGVEAGLVASTGAVGVSAGVGMTVGAEVSATVSIPIHDPIPEPELQAQRTGMPYSPQVGDPNGSFDDAQQAVFGPTHNGSISPAGDVDWWKFDLPSADTVGVTFHHDQDLIVHYLIYDSDGNLLVWSAGYSWSFDLGAGEYRMAVHSYGSHTTGDYIFSLSTIEEGTALVKTGENWIEEGSINSDDDGVMEAGEDVRVKVRLRNDSSSTITDIDATLFTDDAAINITDYDVYYDNFDPGESLWPFGWHDMELNFSLTEPNTRTSDFTLSVTYEIDGQPYYQNFNFDEVFYWQGDHSSFSILNPAPTPNDDPSIRFRNNDDGIFQSSEEIRIRPLLELNGNSLIPEATSIDVTLLYDGTEIEVDPGSERYPDLEPGQSGYPIPGDYDYFWIKSNILSFSGTVYIDVQIEYNEGETVVIPNAIAITVEPAPVIDIVEETWSFGVVSPGDPINHSIRVENRGSQLLTVSNVTASDPDTTIDPEDQLFTVVPGGYHDVSVSIDTTGISNGTSISRLITFVSDGRLMDNTPPSNTTIVTGTVRSGSIWNVPDSMPEPYYTIDISGTRIVWQDERSGSDIYVYDAATGQETNLTPIPSAQEAPRISGDIVAWTDNRNGNGDIYAFDLASQQEFLVAGTTVREELIGVDGDWIAFARQDFTYDSYGQSQGGLNVYIYGISSGQITKITDYSASPGSPLWSAEVSSSTGDFADGVLVWLAGRHDWIGGGNGWNNGYNTPSVTKYAIGVGSSPEILKEGFESGPVTSGGRVVWTEDVSSDEQVFLWESDSITQITSSGNDVGGDALAFSGDIIVYDKGGSSNPGLFYWDLSIGSPDYVLTDSPESCEAARMDGNGIVWLGRDPGPKVFYTFLNQPDIAISSANLTFSNDDPIEGDTIDVSILVRNLTDYDQMDDITVKLYDGDPDAGGTQLGSDQVISGGLVGQGETTVEFTGLPVPENAGGTEEETHQIYIRVSVPGFDNPDNNTASGYLTVYDNDTESPSISNVLDEDYNGDDDGIIGADEQIRISWALSDPSGVGSTSLWIDFDGDGLGSPGSRDPDDVTALGGDYWIVLGPLTVGDYDFVIDAVDADNSPASSSYYGTFTVVAAEEIDISFNGVAIVSGDPTPIDAGQFWLDASNSNLVFMVRNNGDQTLTLGNLTVQVNQGTINWSDPVATSIPANGNPTYFVITPDTSTVGPFSCDVSLANSDSDENPFNFSITGTVTAAPAEITVSGNGYNIADGDTSPSSLDWTDFGSVVQGQTGPTCTFTVTNDGGSTLTLGSVNLPTGYTLTDGLSSSLAAGANDTFTVRLDSSVVGTKSGEISFTNNDSDENPFNFSITGQVTNINMAPTDISLSANTVAENGPVGTTVGNLSTTDPNIGDTFTYSLVNGTGDTDNGSFNIVGSGLQTNEVFDYESKSSYSIRVRTTDQGSLYTDEVFTIDITDVNDAPTVTTSGGSVSYIQGDGAVVVDAGLIVTDIDDTDLEGATISISSGYVNGEDTLSFTNQLGITGNWDSTTGILTLSGTSSVANYQTALRSITYTNSNQDPDSTTRTVSFVVNDGDNDSNTATRDISVSAVKIDLDAKGKAQFTDADGDLVTVTLKGGGTGTLYFAHSGPCDMDHIELTGTNQKSSLTIKTKGKSSTTIKDIIVHGSLKSIAAKTTDLLGDITIDGWVGSILMDDVADDHVITIGGSGGYKPITLKFDKVADLTIDSDTPIKSITATEWIGGSITTLWISSLSIKGDFNADVILSGSDTKGIGLNKFTVAGKITDSSILVQNGSIKKLTIKGIKGYNGDCFINSNIVAANIDTISLICPQYDNTGVPFGLEADFIKKVTITDNNGKKSFKNLRSPADSKQIQDFEIRIV